MDMIIIAIVGLFQAVSVAIIGGLFARDNKKRKKENEYIEERAKTRKKESLLSMKLISSNNKLAIATAHALRDGKSNGDMTKALEEAGKAQEAYYEFIDNIASERLA